MAMPMTQIPSPAEGLQHRAGQGRAQRAAEEEGRHVDGVQPVPDAGIELVDLALAEDEIGLDAEVDQDAGRNQRDERGLAEQRGDEGQDHRRDGRDGADAGVAAVGEPPGDRRGEDAEDTGQREQRDAARRKAVGLAQQDDRRRRPEQRERSEHRGVIEPAPAQHLLMHEQLAERGDQRAIAARALRPPLRQQHQPGDHQHSDQRAGQAEDAAPADIVGKEARGRPGQQDAGQKSAHHVADDGAALVRRGQIGGERHQHLRGGRRDADEQHRREQRRQARRQRQAGQRHEIGRHGEEDQPAVLDDVAERHQQDEADGVADLRHGDDGAFGGHRQAGIRADQRDEGLGVIEIGRQRAAGKGEEDGQHRAEAGRPYDRAGRTVGRACHGGSLCHRSGPVGSGASRFGGMAMRRRHFAGAR